MTTHYFLKKENFLILVVFHPSPFGTIIQVKCSFGGYDGASDKCCLDKKVGESSEVK